MKAAVIHEFGDVDVLKVEDVPTPKPKPGHVLVKAVARWNTRHAQRRRLNYMPNHLLRDIGIRRDQLDTMVSVCRLT